MTSHLVRASIIITIFPRAQRANQGKTKLSATNFFFGTRQVVTKQRISRVGACRYLGNKASIASSEPRWSRSLPSLLPLSNCYWAVFDQLYSHIARQPLSGDMASQQPQQPVFPPPSAGVPVQIPADSSVWDRISSWVSEHKAVVYTIAGVTVAVAAGGVVYYSTTSVRVAHSYPLASLPLLFALCIPRLLKYSSPLFASLGTPS